MFHVLALNSGSSSLKFGLFRVNATGTERLFADTVSTTDPLEAIYRVTRILGTANLPPPDAIGHRIVHGGPALRQHCRIDEAVLRQLHAAAAFAPLHTPAALALIGFAQTHFPGVPQVACFDTHFHANLPEVARVLPIAKALQMDGIQRYGFHGLSLESIVRQVRDDLSSDSSAQPSAQASLQLSAQFPERLIVAHLGNGASITAIKTGKSIDTSMGLTPTGGVMMGTRSGDLDPGVLVHLMREKKFDTAQLESLVDRHSGLLGVSGVSSDLRRLHEAAASNPDARLAIEMFCYSVRKQIAAMIAVLDGLDMLVFTGGIGENDAPVRAAICAGLKCFGVSLDETRNRSASKAINDRASCCAVQVLASQEEEQIARHTWALIG
jgi:acetate kinase